MKIKSIHPKYTLQTIPVGIPYHYPDSDTVMIILNDCSTNNRVIVDLTFNQVRAIMKDDDSPCIPISHDISVIRIKRQLTLLKVYC